MSFRDRTDRPTDWDAEDEAGLAAWPSRPRQNRHRDAASYASGDDEPWADEAWAGDLGGSQERTRRRASGGRRGPVEDDVEQQTRERPWPDLRDSLRGGARKGGSDRGSGGSTDAVSRPRRRASYPPESRWTGRSAAWDEPGEDEFLADAEAPPYPPVPRHRPGRSATRGRRSASARTGPALRMPAAVGAVLLSQDRLVAGVLGGSALSLLLMAMTISLRNNALPAWIAIHINAAGEPDRWGTPATVWRVPLMAAMLTIMNVIAGSFLARWDRFAAQVLLGSSILIHVLAWMALIGLLW